MAEKYYPISQSFQVLWSVLSHVERTDHLAEDAFSQSVARSFPVFSSGDIYDVVQRIRGVQQQQSIMNNPS